MKSQALWYAIYNTSSREMETGGYLGAPGHSTETNQGVLGLVRDLCYHTQVALEWWYTPLIPALRRQRQSDL